MIYNTTILEFGDGDIIQHGGLCEETGKPIVLMQYTDTPLKPGARVEDLPEEFFKRPDVVLRFKDIQAIDRLIDYLKGLKNYAKNHSNKPEESHDD